MDPHKKLHMNAGINLEHVNLEKCFKCGHEHYSNTSVCLARNKKCKKCGEIGHFAKFCAKIKIKKENNINIERNNFQKNMENNENKIYSTKEFKDVREDICNNTLNTKFSSNLAIFIFNF